MLTALIKEHKNAMHNLQAKLSNQSINSDIAKLMLIKLWNIWVDLDATITKLKE